MAIKASNQITITDITDAFAVNLSSEAYVFTATGSTVPASSACSTTVSALCGSTSIMPSVTVSEITFTAEGVSGNLSSSTTPKAPSVTKSDDTTNKLTTLTSEYNGLNIKRETYNSELNKSNKKLLDIRNKIDILIY